MQSRMTDKRRGGEPIQYVRFGEPAAVDDPAQGVPCFEAVFDHGRIHILTDGVDPQIAGRILAGARAERQRIQLVVGQPIGLAPGGATLVAVGFEQPLFAYSIDDVDLMPALAQAQPIRTRLDEPDAHRLVA